MPCCEKRERIDAETLLLRGRDGGGGGDDEDDGGDDVEVAIGGDDDDGGESANEIGGQEGLTKAKWSQSMRQMRQAAPPARLECKMSS